MKSEHEEKKRNNENFPGALGKPDSVSIVRGGAEYYWNWVTIGVKRIETNKKRTGKSNFSKANSKVQKEKALLSLPRRLDTSSQNHMIITGYKQTFLKAACIFQVREREC